MDDASVPGVTGVLNYKPETLKPKPVSLNPKPETLNPKPETLNSNVSQVSLVS